MLEDEFQARKQREPRATLRRFADDLGLSASMLCHVLKGRKRLSTEAAMRVAASLPWSAEKRAAFLLSARAAGGNAVLEDAPSRRYARTATPVDLSNEVFEAVSQWQHPVLLECLRLPGTLHGTSDLAQLIGVSKSVAREALERLCTLGLVVKEGTQWRRNVGSHVRVASAPSGAVREFHKSMLNKAWESLDTVESARRDITGVVVATSPARIEEAKKRIAAFRSELMAHLEEGEPTCLYHLAVQLFPLTEEPRDKAL